MVEFLPFKEKVLVQVQVFSKPSPPLHATSHKPLHFVACGLWLVESGGRESGLWRVIRVRSSSFVFVGGERQHGPKLPFINIIYLMNIHTNLTNRWEDYKYEH